MSWGCWLHPCQLSILHEDLDIVAMIDTSDQSCRPAEACNFFLLVLVQLRDTAQAHGRLVWSNGHD